jgi:hypothetical protein
MKPITLKIRKRAGDYHVSVLEMRDQWGCGPSIEAAIGDLVTSFPETFNVILSEKDYTPPYTKGHLNGVPQFDCPIESGYSHT